MTEAEQTKPRPHIVRRIPVAVSLIEVDDGEGGKKWAVCYSAEVDGRYIESAALVPAFGGSKTPDDAIKVAASRPGLFGGPF